MIPVLEDVVIDNEEHYHLTLSGHTHGMQFGIEIPGWIKWSPVMALQILGRYL